MRSQALELQLLEKEGNVRDANEREAKAVRAQQEATDRADQMERQVNEAQRLTKDAEERYSLYPIPCTAHK